MAIVMGRIEVECAGAGDGQDEDDGLGAVGDRRQRVERERREPFDRGDLFLARCRASERGGPTRRCQKDASARARDSGLRRLRHRHALYESAGCPVAVLSVVRTSSQRCVVSVIARWNSGNWWPVNDAGTRWRSTRTRGTATNSTSSPARSARTACSRSGARRRCSGAPPSWSASAGATAAQQAQGVAAEARAAGAARRDRAAHGDQRAFRGGVAERGDGRELFHRLHRRSGSITWAATATASCPWRIVGSSRTVSSRPIGGRRTRSSARED